MITGVHTYVYMQIMFGISIVIVYLPKPRDPGSGRARFFPLGSPFRVTTSPQFRLRYSLFGAILAAEVLNFDMFHIQRHALGNAQRHGRRMQKHPLEGNLLALPGFG